MAKRSANPHKKSPGQAEPAPPAVLGESVSTEAADSPNALAETVGPSLSEAIPDPSPDHSSAALTPDSLAASSAPSTPAVTELPRISPRTSAADSFEQNPLSALREQELRNADRMALDDGTRLREALRGVIEEGDTLKDAGREWNVAPSAIAEWRERYQALLREHPPEATPLMEDGDRHGTEHLSHIPDIARGIFIQNWERLVTETAATPSDFVQSPRRIFLQTSPLTSWLFQDGRVDRGILAGVVSGLIGLALLASFLMAQQNPALTVAPPEPAPRDDLVIEEAAAVAQSFFKAANWEERLKYVRQPEAVRSMMQEYYQNRPDGPIDDASLSLAMPVRHIVNLSYDIPSLDRSHFLCVILFKGRHLVDWESSSLYQEEQINRLRAARSTEPTRIAVTVMKNPDAAYHNYAFANTTEWECYQLGYPGLNINLFGYAKKESVNAIELDAMLGIVDKQAAVLEVRFPATAATDNQVEIITVLRGEWVPVDP